MRAVAAQNRPVQAGHSTDRSRPLVLAILSFAWSGMALASADAPDDTAALFKTTCAICHEVPETKAPPTATLRQLPALIRDTRLRTVLSANAAMIQNRPPPRRRPAKSYQILKTIDNSCAMCYYIVTTQIHQEAKWTIPKR